MAIPKHVKYELAPETSRILVRHQKVLHVLVQICPDAFVEIGKHESDGPTGFEDTAKLLKGGHQIIEGNLLQEVHARDAIDAALVERKPFSNVSGNVDSGTAIPVHIDPAASGSSAAPAVQSRDFGCQLSNTRPRSRAVPRVRGWWPPLVTRCQQRLNHLLRLLERRDC